jgi:hypothetical protein
MADTSLDVLQHAGEMRGEIGAMPNAADFDEHVRFYKQTLRVVAIFLAHVAVLLLAMYFFLVR